MRVSIITLTNDSSRYVDEAIGRVERGRFCELDHVVVHDGAGGFIERLAGRYPHLRLLRGNGTGATAAAALGVRAATGDFILFVHSDDRICAEAIGQLAIQSCARPDIRIWSGGAQIFVATSEGVLKNTPQLARKQIPCSTRDIILAACHRPAKCGRSFSTRRSAWCCAASSARRYGAPSNGRRQANGRRETD